METDHTKRSKATPLVIGADILDNRCETGSDGIKPFGDLLQTFVKRVQSGAHRGLVVADGLVSLGRSAAVQHRLEVLGVPVERCGQRLQSPRTTAPLDRVMLEFTDDGLRDVRTLGKLSLSPTQHIHALVDGPGDCRPIFRHVFLRAPPRRRD
jgi:hypothetical protein